MSTDISLQWDEVTRIIVVDKDGNTYQLTKKDLCHYLKDWLTDVFREAIETVVSEG